MSEGVLAARVSAPPVEDRANRALCRPIARHAGVAPTAVTIVRGHRSREKLVHIAGIDQAVVQRLFAAGGSAR